MQIKFYSKVIKPENLNPTKRFSNRVLDYIKYRPSYPEQIFKEIINPILNNNDDPVVADLGSGTGIFSKLILDNTIAKKLYCVEPNKEMREAAESLLGSYDKNRLISINGTGEVTTLNNNTCDLVTSAQAFHWFKIREAKDEIKRILKSNGNLFLVWNIRNDDTPCLKSYDKLMIKYSKEYESVYVRTIDKKDLDVIYDHYNEKCFPHKQTFDLEGFLGRLRSSSWCPESNSKDFEILMSEMTNLFNQYQVDGRVEFLYNTKCYNGKI